MKGMREVGSPTLPRGAALPIYCPSCSRARSSRGGSCEVDLIPWELQGCGSVNVIRRQITILGLGVVNCDAEIQLGMAGPRIRI